MSREHPEEMGCHMEKLLTVKELADLLGFAEKTIRWKVVRCPEALPPTIKIPHSNIIRFRESDVKAWLDSLVIKTSGQDPEDKGVQNG